MAKTSDVVEKLKWRRVETDKYWAETAHRGKCDFMLRYTPPTLSRGAYWKLIICDSGEYMKTQKPEYINPLEAAQEAEEYQEWKREI